MKRTALAFAAIVALALPGIAGEITVTGTGTVRLPPDKMQMTFQVAASDLDATVAKQTFMERTAALAATLSELGVATNEVLTSGLNMEVVREYENGKRVFRGYMFSENYSFIAKVDRARLERVYTALVDCKIIEELNLSFGLFDPAAPQEEARTLAVKNARAIAEGIASAAGVKLGKVSEIVYGSSGDRGEYGMRLKSAVFAPTDGISSQVGALHDIEVSDTVRIRWKLK